MIAPAKSLQTPGDRGGLDFMGPEFLTWLWWRSEVDPGFEHEDGTKVFVHFDEHLEFRGERSAARRVTLRTGMPGASMEARAALRSGKMLYSARILLARGEDEVHFTLRAEDLDISSMRLPAPEGETLEDRRTACLDAQDLFLSDLDLCLAVFLNVRCSSEWGAQAEQMRSWGRTPSQDERVLA